MTRYRMSMISILSGMRVCVYGMCMCYVYVCVYVRTYVCMYVCMYTSLIFRTTAGEHHADTHTHIHTYTFTHIHTHTHTHTYTYTHTHTYTHTPPIRLPEMSRHAALCSSFAPESIILTQTHTHTHTQTTHTRLPEMRRYAALRSSFAPLLESIIILDRICYLQQALGAERVHAEVVPLFDPVASPRSTAIVAYKHSK